MIQGLGTDSRGWALQRVAMVGATAATPSTTALRQSDNRPGPTRSTRWRATPCPSSTPRGGPGPRDGASMGGVIAQIIGVLHPERVRSLVLACTACSHHDWRREAVADGPRSLRARGSCAERGRPPLAGRTTDPAPVRGGCGSTSSPGSCCSSRPTRSWPRSTPSSTPPTSLRTELVRVCAPTLVIHRSAGFPDPRGRRGGDRRAIPGCQMVILSGAAHGLMVEAPIAYNDAVLEFLEWVDSAGGSAGGGAEGRGQEQPRTARTA